MEVNQRLTATSSNIVNLSKIDWNQIGNLLDIDWEQIVNLLEIHWEQIGNLLEIDWEQIGNSLETSPKLIRIWDNWILLGSNDKPAWTLTCPILAG